MPLIGFAKLALVLLQNKLVVAYDYSQNYRF